MKLQTIIAFISSALLIVLCFYECHLKHFVFEITAFLQMKVLHFQNSSKYALNIKNLF